MRWLIIIYFLTVYTAGYTQDNWYIQSVEANRNQKTDSAFLYINKAIDLFRKEKKTDSLVLSYTHKADMVWEQTGNRAALKILDETLNIARSLPAGSIALVAFLNKKAQIHVHNAETATAKKYFFEALKQVPPHAKANSIYSSLYNNVSWLYLNLQDFTPALQYAEQAKKINEELYGKDARQLISIYQSLMYITHDAEQYNQAEQYGLEMYRLAQLNFSPDHPKMGLVHNDLGSLYETLHRYDEALFHRQAMVRIIQKDYAKHKNPQLLAIAYNNMGKLYDATGEFHLAEEYYEKAAQLHEINFGADGAGFVRPLTHLANAKRESGKFAEAEKLYARAYSLQQQVDPSDRINMAYVQSQYGDLFLGEDNFTQAEDYYKKALTNYKKAGISNTTIVEETRNTLAQTYARSGRTELAFPILEAILKRYREIRAPGDISIAGQYNKISEVWMLSNQPEKALLYSDSVFMELLQVSSLPDGDWVKNLPYSYQIIQYLQNRAAIEAAIHKRTGRLSALEALIAVADHYSGYLEKSLPALRTQASLMQLAKQHKAIYNTAIEACWVLFEQKNDRRFLDRAFSFSERSKALILRLASNNILIDASQGSHTETEKRDLYWRKTISSLNARYMDEGRKNDSLLTLLTASIEAYYRFQDSVLHSAENSMLKSRYSLRPISIPEIQAGLLTEKQTLLEYAITDDHIFLFVLTDKDFFAYRLPVHILSKVSELKQLYSVTPEKFRNAAYPLYNGLIKPAQKHFTSGKLIIVPDGDLFYLNFELLLLDDQQKDFAQMNYLIHRYEISYQLSATNAVQTPASQAKEQKAMLLTPVFTDNMKKAYLQFMGDSLAADKQYFSLLRQPFAMKAVQQISRYIKNDLYAEQDAEEAVFKRTAGLYNILHLGTHAEINNQAPLQSRFFLAKQLSADSVTNEDGYLHAYEIYGMHLQAELAVLTACETGSGSLTQGEGVISLAHSFMYAGCPSVIMSLWKIDEKASAGIIAGFYKYLSEGKTKSEALRLAKLEHIKASDLSSAHPYFWAGMTLVGNEKPVFETSYSKIWTIAAALALLSGIVWFVRSKRKR
ncbi:MAG: CHAT domain-containing protein [Chitinophagaceae bacterium]|nr:CHAT domain-containing protein [Chitinophagaceae bacterium]